MSPSDKQDAAQPKQLKYEEMLNRLEIIIEKMEGSDIPLDESLNLYKEGVDLCVRCVETLKKTRQEVFIVAQNGEKVITEAFES